MSDVVYNVHNDGAEDSIWEGVSDVSMMVSRTQFAIVRYLLLCTSSAAAARADGQLDRGTNGNIT